MTNGTHPLKLLRDRLMERLEGVADPRVQGRCLYSIEEILVLTFCALLCGAENYTSIRWFGMTRRKWLKRWVDLRHGIPSDDTIRRVLGLIDPQALEQILWQWAQDYSLAHQHHDRHARVMLDGKAVRGTEKHVSHGKRPLQLMNIYDHEQGVVLGQKKAAGSGQSELKAAIQCLQMLNLRGTLVSLDAALSSAKITDAIRNKKGDYIIPIKANSSLLYNIIRDNAHGFKLRSPKYSSRYHCDEGYAHGRYEKRECVAVYSNTILDKLRVHRQEVKTLFEITRYREQRDKRPVYISSKDGLRRSTESCFYVSSRTLTPAKCLKHVREHWDIENKLHWSLDVSFGEDRSKVRDKRAARNLSAMRKIAYNLFTVVPDPTALIEKPPGRPVGRLTKMKIASLDEGYLELLLEAFAQPRHCPRKVA